ncbi:MAG: peptidase U62, modulator of DNA gyrase [uncultured bacterium]|nr:MAG: peptidase U62, modulator of DNA gyrase [uncultured bacterium]
MQDEMVRSKNELILPASPAPFFVAYTVGENQYISVSSTLGVIISSKESAKERLHAVNLYVGDSKFSSDYSYTGNGVQSTSFTTRDDNYDQLRRNFWQTSDLSYKLAVEVYNSKKNNIKTANIAEEEKALPDLLPLKKVEVYATAEPALNLSKKSYEDLSKLLSKEFAKYPQISDSRVEVDGVETVYYYLSTEGTKVKEKESYVGITLRGKVRNNKGQLVQEAETIFAPSFEQLPTYEILTARVNKFSEKLVSLCNAETMTEYYYGPVLFENEAVATILSENLVSQSGIISIRKPIQVMASVSRVENIGNLRDIKPLEERINKKVIDSRLSVSNKTDLKNFNGMFLLGNYEMDAQGVAPVKDVKLIENGILKSLLSSRVPTRKIAESTGSVRFGVRPRSIVTGVAPGALVVSSLNGSSKEELKAELIKAAIEEGLDYAYIVRNIASETTQYVYKVSVKDGSETLVTGTEVTPVPLTKLKRVLGVSKEQEATNYLYKGSIPTSIIYPKAILIEDIEINKKPLSIQKESPLISK